MLDMNLLFKIGGAGILIIILDMVLRASKKDDVAGTLYLAGIVILLLMVLTLINQLFTSLRTMFMF